MIIAVQNHAVLVLPDRSIEPQEFQMLAWFVSSEEFKTVCPIAAVSVWDCAEWKENWGVKRPDKCVLASDGSLHDTTDAWCAYVRAKGKRGGAK